MQVLFKVLKANNVEVKQTRGHFESIARKEKYAKLILLHFKYFTIGRGLFRSYILLVYHL